MTSSAVRHPTQRALGQPGQVYEVRDVEQMGQFVHQMTQEQTKRMQAVAAGFIELQQQQQQAQLAQQQQQQQQAQLAQQQQQQQQAQLAQQQQQQQQAQPPSQQEPAAAMEVDQ
jgi:hypothetical protein